jgi:S1-C subfamily serine protease
VLLRCTNRMTKATLYSSSRRRAAVSAAAPPVAAERAPGWRERLRAHRVLIAAALPGIAALAVVLFLIGWGQRPAALTQEDIDAAVAQSLESVPLPSPATKAYEAVRGSIVRVRAFTEGPDGGEVEGGVGTGVVILDKGVILTNIHVVQGAKRIGLTFAEGMETTAVVTGTRPEDDLAVLQAQEIPDDLQAATLQSTSGLSPGDYVTAVGFPFGIGPSVSSGVVSGLRREYRSPEGKRLLTNLIQFDAAVNPGNSGGPLLNASGEVVGIVTGILNPTEQRVFVGIGFAVPIENAAAAVGVPPF